MIKKIVAAILLFIFNTFSVFAFDTFDYLDDVNAVSDKPFTAYNSLYFGASYENILNAFPSSQWEVVQTAKFNDGYFYMRFKRPYTIITSTKVNIPAYQIIEVVGAPYGMKNFTINFNVNDESMANLTYHTFTNNLDLKLGYVKETQYNNVVAKKWKREDGMQILVTKTHVKYGQEYKYYSIMMVVDNPHV